MKRIQREGLVDEICNAIQHDGVLGARDNLSDDSFRALIQQYFDKIVSPKGLVMSMIDRANIESGVFHRYRGFGILFELLNDDEVTEIMVNGCDNIFVEKQGKIIETDCRFKDDTELRQTIQNIVARTNRVINDAVPIADARLSDGSRVNAVLDPVSLDGATLTIRKFSKKPMTMERLIGYGSLSAEVANKLKLLVKAKYNIFISGGTGSGKTTFLNALSNFIPHDERIITIEDSAELQITSDIKNIVRLEKREKITEGSSEISIKDLIKTSLRMRPERIIVGEVRGEEALDMLQAMNTGHDGSLSTGHANSSADMLSRLETMVLQGSAMLPLEAIRQQIGSAIDIIIHLSRFRDRSRKVAEIVEIVGYQNGQYITNPLWIFEERDSESSDKVIGRLKRTDNKLKHTQKLRNAGIKIEI